MGPRRGGILPQSLADLLIKIMFRVNRKPIYPSRMTSKYQLYRIVTGGHLQRARILRDELEIDMCEKFSHKKKKGLTADAVSP
jgi:hypothetical protein